MIKYCEYCGNLAHQSNKKAALNNSTEHKNFKQDFNSLVASVNTLEEGIQLFRKSGIGGPPLTLMAMDPDDVEVTSSLYNKGMESISKARQALDLLEGDMKNLKDEFKAFEKSAQILLSKKTSNR